MHTSKQQVSESHELTLGVKVRVMFALTPVAKWPGRDWEASRTLPYSGGTCAVQNRTQSSDTEKHKRNVLVLQRDWEAFRTLPYSGGTCEQHKT